MLSWKIPEYCSMDGAICKKNSIFAFFRIPSSVLRTAYRKQFYPKPVAPMESGDSEGVHFASLESLTRRLADTGPWRVPKNGHVTITKFENLHIDPHAILFDLRRKITKLSRKNRFRTVASPGAWPSWIDALYTSWCYWRHSRCYCNNVQFWPKIAGLRKRCFLSTWTKCSGLKVTSECKSYSHNINLYARH